MTVQAWNKHVIHGSFLIRLVIPGLISTEREVRGGILLSCRLISPFLWTKGEVKGAIPLCKFTPITTQKDVKK